MTAPAGVFVHERGLCEFSTVGAGTRVWAFAHVLPGALIGADCNICDHVFIENDVVVGDRVTVKCGVQLWDGVRLGNDVFVGPNATFTNDHLPPLQGTIPESSADRRRDGASIGANATILPGVRIGRKAMVGAGAVVTHDVPPMPSSSAIPASSPATTNGRLQPAASRRPQRWPTRPVELALGGGRCRPLRCRTSRPARRPGAGEFARTFRSTARSFMVYGVPSTQVRGEHAHHTCHQFLVAVARQPARWWPTTAKAARGRAGHPRPGLYLPPMVWGIQYKFTADAVLLVFASHPYDADDYIRDYDTFLKVVHAEPSS